MPVQTRASSSNEVLARDGAGSQTVPFAQATETRGNQGFDKTRVLPGNYESVAANLPSSVLKNVSPLALAEVNPSRISGSVEALSGTTAVSSVPQVAQANPVQLSAAHGPAQPKKNEIPQTLGLSTLPEVEKEGPEIRTYREQLFQDAKRHEALRQVQEAVLIWTPLEHPFRPPVATISSTSAVTVAMNPVESYPADKVSTPPRAFLMAPLEVIDKDIPTAWLQQERAENIEETVRENVAPTVTIGNNRALNPPSGFETDREDFVAPSLGVSLYSEPMQPILKDEGYALSATSVPLNASLPDIRPQEILPTQFRSRLVRVPVVNVLDMVF